MDYKDINDYELIYEVRERNEIAYNTLYEKYRTLITKIAYEYYLVNRKKRVEFEDLVQEGYYALSVAVKEYDEKSTLFYTYVSLCIKREMERYIKGCGRNKNMVLSDAVSLNETVDKNGDILLEEVVPSKDDVEKYVLSEDVFNKLWSFRHELSNEESLVFELKANKFSNNEICELLDMPYKKVDNYLRKIRLELTKYMKTIY